MERSENSGSGWQITNTIEIMKNKAILTATLAISTVSMFAVQKNSVSDLKGSKPNIIHILADDIGWDDFGCYLSKDIKTPNIDKLANNGVKFTDFYAPASVCTPSRVAILTGKYAPKVKGGTAILFPSSTKGVSYKEEKLIPSYLKPHGYKTALIGKWHLGHLPDYLPTAHGFDYHFGIPYCNDHGPERNKYNGNKGWPEIPLLENSKTIEQPVDLHNLPLRFVNKVCNFIKKNKSTTFYIQYANIETHTPWYVPKKFQGKSKAGAYGDAVELFDWSVGEIVKTLKKHNLLDNTLIVISSDNGPLYKKRQEFIDCYGKFGNVDTNRKHILKAGKGASHAEGGPRVACIAHWPDKIAKGKTCSKLAAGIDFLPTFAFLAGEKISPEMKLDGKNILPLMINPESESPHDYILSFGGKRLRGIRKGKWKLAIQRGKVALYDLSRDIQEKNDLSQRFPNIVNEMKNISKSYNH